MFGISYDTWKSVCDMYFSLKNGTQKAYLQWFPFTKLSSADKESISGVEFYNSYIDSNLRKPNYKKFYREGTLISFYAGVEDSEHVIKHAHELRNANPLLHASSQLLDRNDTSEDLRESIKALSTLIYGYIDNHREHT